MNSSTLCGFAALLVLAACQSHIPSESETRPPGITVLSASELAEARYGRVDFATHIRPILESKCVMCHNQEAQPGKMDLSNRAVAARTGALGVWIVPGKPDQSLLLTKLNDAPAHLKAMPPVGEQITRDELSIMKKWIAEGATWPSGKSGNLTVPK